ncbi:MAG TPA: vanadium-dependent haloperoxidase [Nitrososphaeraceae archaeon]|nr:vanadium-dependent haloperoxidase [Nitrososphaeraceae archaeon]
MVNPLPNDRIPEPKNRRNAVADISLPNTTVMHDNNKEEMDYQAAGHPKGIASFTKGLNHNSMGEVLNSADFDQFLNAIQDSLADVPNYSNSLSLFENLPIGSGVVAGKPKAKLVNPVCGLSYDSEGLDAFNRIMLPAPRMDSLNGAAEIAELYWMYLMRDINFTDYDEEDIAEDAITDLKNNFGAYNFTIETLNTSWTKTGIALSPKTLFRGINVGDNVGPYISQFMLRGNIDKPIKRNEKHGHVKYGTTSIDQKHVVAKKELDFMTDNQSWLNVQNGLYTYADRVADNNNKYFDDEPRFIRNLRDLATYVHYDALYQAYLTACLYMLNDSGGENNSNRFSISEGIPYKTLQKQEGFGNYGGPHILSLLTEVATRALKAVWFQKWFVHRRLRPEAFAGLIHHHIKSNKTKYPFIHQSILNSPVLEKVAKRNKELNKDLESDNPDKNKETYSLGQAFPEGSPLHPSYGAGHATVAGACVTILKAWFADGDMPGPIVEANHNGKELKNYEGNDKDQIKIHGELNKLAANVAIGRNGAGVHYRSDYTVSLILGEEVAISILKELKSYLPEQTVFNFRRFFTDAPITI